MTDGPDADEFELQPPSAERVARRALCLSAVAARGFLEGDAPADGEQHRADMLDWLREHDLVRELEPMELALLESPVGSLDAQDVVNATWRSESVALLAWVLGMRDLPPHDEMVDVGEVTSDLGFLDDPVGLHSPSLRADAEISWMRARLLGLHWRLREFSLRPQSIDYRAFAAECPFGSFDIEGIDLVDGDLAIEGMGIADADAEVRAAALSIAMERHQAMDWVRGHGRVFSKVEPSM